MNDFMDDMVDVARRFAEDINQYLLAFAKSVNPEAAILPQIMVSDFSSRNCLKADIYVKSGHARGYVVLKKHKSGEGYWWLISNGYSCFIDLGLAAANIADAKKMFSDLNGRGRGEAFKVEVVDITGVGDTFHGVFTYEVASGWDTARCAEFAAAVAAIKCNKLGGRTGLPEALDFLDRHRSPDQSQTGYALR